MDRERRILHAGGGALAPHGLGTDGWIGQAIDQVLPVEEVGRLLPHYEAALRGEPQAFEYRSHDATRLYHVQLAPVSDDSGAIGSVVAVMQDVTDRARITADLARSEGRLREAERMVGVGSWELSSPPVRSPTRPAWPG